MKEWIISLISGLVGVGITILASWYFFNKELEISRKVEMIKLSRELVNEFYKEDNTFKDIRNAIDQCKTLYQSWGGEFTYDQLNLYLGFFDDIGFYAEKDVIDYDVIDQFFGAHIIEAYEKKEIRKYIDDARRNNEQPRAYDDFQMLARKLEEIPENKKLAENLRQKPCFMRDPSL